MLATHRAAGTWRRYVDAHIVPTAFLLEKLVEAGIPRSRLHVKGNFVDPDPRVGSGDGHFALFIGRLAEEKGVGFLLRAWLDAPALPLLIAGDGPLAPSVRAHANADSLRWLGRQTRHEIAELLHRATCLVIPSMWYEGQPNVILEAFAAGVPVIASALGGMASTVEHGVNGLLVPPGDEMALRAAVAAIAGDPTLAARLRVGARAAFEKYYAAEANGRRLEEIYAAARSALSQRLKQS